MSQHHLPHLSQLRTDSFSSRRIPVPQDPHHETQEDCGYESDIEPNTTQAHISVHISPQILELPLPPESQPLQLMAPIDRGPQERTSTGNHPRTALTIIPELVNIMTSGLNPYVFRTSTTAPTLPMLNISNRTRWSIPILNTPWSETARSPIIPPTWPTTPIQHTSNHPILRELLLLSKDHDSTEIQTAWARLDKNLENGPLNMETLTLVMDLVIAVFHKESLQHLITKKPDCITVIKRNLELRSWSKAVELYQEEEKSIANDCSSVTIWYPYPLATMAKEVLWNRFSMVHDHIYLPWCTLHFMIFYHVGHQCHDW